MVTLDVDAIPTGVPNPPPWRVNYINDTEAPPSYKGVLPEAHTEGLLQFGHPEIQIRLASPNQASVILDRVGIWLVFEKAKVYPDQQIKILGEVYTIVASVDSTHRPVFRLAWRKDPRPGTNSMLEAITEFNAVMAINGLPPTRLPEPSK